MITQAVDQHRFVRRARQIATRIPTLLDEWGLVPKFKHWRLVQDSETGMVVLFGVLDNEYITTHTTSQFSDYFDPRLLRDLATELDVQMVSSSNDGLRYTFILERGKSGPPKDMPAPLALAFETMCPPPRETLEHYLANQTFSNNSVLGNEHTTMRQRLARFLRITGALDVMNTGATQPLPDVLFMDEAEFNHQMAMYEATQFYTQQAG